MNSPTFAVYNRDSILVDTFDLQPINISFDYYPNRSINTFKAILDTNMVTLIQILTNTNQSETTSVSTTISCQRGANVSASLSLSRNNEVIYQDSSKINIIDTMFVSMVILTVSRSVIQLYPLNRHQILI